MQIYCVKCKHKTETRNAHKAAVGGGRSAIKGTCASCGTKKCQFVKGGKGFLSNLARKGLQAGISAATPFVKDQAASLLNKGLDAGVSALASKIGGSGVMGRGVRGRGMRRSYAKRHARGMFGNILGQMLPF